MFGLKWNTRATMTPQVGSVLWSSTTAMAERAAAAVRATATVSAPAQATVRLASENALEAAITRLNDVAPATRTSEFDAAHTDFRFACGAKSAARAMTRLRRQGDVREMRTMIADALYDTYDKLERRAA